MGTRTGLVRLLRAKGVEHQLLETPAGGWALVVPALGARVLGAGLGERNAFWVSPALEGWNAGGLRTWLAPELGPRGFFGREEGDWAVAPALDPGAYRLVETGPAAALCRGECRIRSADGTRYHLRIDRQAEIGDLPGRASSCWFSATACATSVRRRPAPTPGSGASCSCPASRKAPCCCPTSPTGPISARRPRTG